MVAHSKTSVIGSFKGLNNVLKPENTPNDYLKKAINVNLDKQGNLSKRKGYSKQSTGNYSCIWSSSKGTRCFAVKDGDLIEILYSLQEVVLDSGGYSSLSFEEVDDDIYFTSRTKSGIIDSLGLRPFGIKSTNPPILSDLSGTLEEGVYQVSYTLIDTFGRESGTSGSTTIQITKGLDISVDIPTSPYSRARIYCSLPNGSVLYFYKEVVTGVSSTISNVVSKANPLRTFNIQEPPLGDTIKYYKGRLYITEGTTLWYSEPQQYEHFRLDSNYIELPDKISDIMPVEEGLWVASDNMYYLSGKDPADFKLSLKERVKMVEGTSQLISGSYILLDNTPVGYKWLVTTDLGIFVLFNKGLIINLTATNLSLQRSDIGTSVFLQDEGTNQYMTILKKKNTPNNSVVGDLVTTSIVRNGIIIN